MEALLDLTQIATDTMQCVCILDDVDDKLEENPHLLEEAGINMVEVQEAMKILRRVSDAAAAAKGRLKSQFHFGGTPPAVVVAGPEARAAQPRATTADREDTTAADREAAAETQATAEPEPTSFVWGDLQ
eukprot:Skav200138  [mRNA]  locus=scaffold4172:289174:289563:- [translate_table: standard]